MSEPLQPQPQPSSVWQQKLQILRQAIERLSEIGEDEADSFLAWQAKKVVQQLEQQFRRENEKGL